MLFNIMVKAERMEPNAVCLRHGLYEDVFNSSIPGQNGRHFGRRQIQMHCLEWKW